MPNYPLKNGGQGYVGHPALADATFAKAISGAGGLIKAGGADLTHTGANRFAGRTAIWSGKMGVGTVADLGR